MLQTSRMQGCQGLALGLSTKGSTEARGQGQPCVSRHEARKAQRWLASGPAPGPEVPLPSTGRSGCGHWWGSGWSSGHGVSAVLGSGAGRPYGEANPKVLELEETRPSRGPRVRAGPRGWGCSHSDLWTRGAEVFSRACGMFSVIPWQ